MTDVSVLKSFVAVMEIGTFAGAARERCYSPATISRHLSRLQGELGMKLFEPRGRSIAPTPIAIELASRARRLVDEIDQYEEYVHGLARVGGARATTVSPAL